MVAGECWNEGMDAATALILAVLALGDIIVIALVRRIKGRLDKANRITHSLRFALRSGVLAHAEAAR